MIYSRTSEYAIRALAYLASAEDPLGIYAIGRKIGVPPAYVSKIFQGLVHSGILDSKTGAKGGYSLRKKPSELKLIQIIRAIDDISRSPFSGCVMAFAQCGEKNPCPLHFIWLKAKKNMEERLNSTTLLDMMEVINSKKPRKRKKVTLSKKMRQVFGQNKRI